VMPAKFGSVSSTLAWAVATAAATIRVRNCIMK
jgi:hypothetical protein